MENNPNTQNTNPAPAAEPVQNTAAPEQAAPAAPAAPAAAKKSMAWLWILIAVGGVLLIGIVVFIIVNNSLKNKAITNYDAAHTVAQSEANSFESAYRKLYSEAGLTGYYDESDDRPKELRNDCLKKFDVDPEVFEVAKEYVKGADVLATIGRKKTEEEAAKLGESVDKLKEAKKNITQCQEMLSDAVMGDIDVQFGEFVATQKSEYSWDTSMKVTVTNVSGTSHSFSLYVVAYDQNGDEIDKEYISTSTLSANQKYTSTIFKYVSRSDIEKMKNATFKVESVDEY